MSGTVAITMAGLGSRFVAEGYPRPKYEIEALGRPLFDWSMLSLQAFRDAGWRFRFAVRAGQGASDYLRARCAVLGITVDEIAELETVTDGQATTALMLAKGAPPEAPFAVYNIDTFVRPGAMVPPDPKSCAGWIPCFAAPGNGWSFARTDDSGRVVELREKQRISDHATVGLYWFDSAARYIDCYTEQFSRPDGTEAGERYIAPMYNRLIESGAEVRLCNLAFEDVGMLGTPDQVRAFIASPPEGAKGVI